MGSPQQDYWSDLLDPGMDSVFLALASRFFMTEPPEKPSLMGEKDINEQIRKLHSSTMEFRKETLSKKSN